jgi:hypothetical protein
MVCHLIQYVDIKFQIWLDDPEPGLRQLMGLIGKPDLADSAIKEFNNRDRLQSPFASANAV